MAVFLAVSVCFSSCYGRVGCGCCGPCLEGRYGKPDQWNHAAVDARLQVATQHRRATTTHQENCPMQGRFQKIIQSPAVQYRRKEPRHKQLHETPPLQLSPPTQSRDVSNSMGIVTCISRFTSAPGFTVFCKELAKSLNGPFLLHCFAGICMKTVHEGGFRETAHQHWRTAHQDRRTLSKLAPRSSSCHISSDF